MTQPLLLWQHDPIGIDRNTGENSDLPIETGVRQFELEVDAVLGNDLIPTLYAAIHIGDEVFA